MDERIHELMKQIGDILKCHEHCEECCVFAEVGTGAGCPLNEFEDRVLEAARR